MYSAKAVNPPRLVIVKRPEVTIFGAPIPAAEQIGGRKIVAISRFPFGEAQVTVIPVE